MNGFIEFEIHSAGEVICHSIGRVGLPETALCNILVVPDGEFDVYLNPDGMLVGFAGQIALGKEHLADAIYVAGTDTDFGKTHPVIGLRGVVYNEIGNGEVPVIGGATGFADAITVFVGNIYIGDSHNDAGRVGERSQVGLLSVIACKHLIAPRAWDGGVVVRSAFATGTGTTGN